MSRSPEALRAEVSRLSLAGRARLLEHLVASLEADEELEAAWKAVADEREADFDTGRAHPVGCADAVTRLEARFPGPRSRCIQIDPMRLSPADRQAIVRATAKVAGADTRVLLFGSHTDDSLRGGDIDLLVECAQPVQRPAWLAAHIEAALVQAIGDNGKIDVLLTAPNLAEQPMHRVARAKGVPL